ncbi:MAG: hypothetical protein ACREC4_00590 [Methylocella sp.]
MAFKTMAVRKYVVRLRKEELGRPHELIRKGKSPAKQQLTARILLKAGSASGGKGWSESKIIKAFNTGISTADRVRQEFGKEVLKPPKNPALRGRSSLRSWHGPGTGATRNFLDRSWR